MKKYAWLAVVVALAACGDPGSTKKEKVPCVDCETEAGSSELSIGELSGELVEGGSAVTSVIKLKRQPSADVQVLMVSLDPDVVTIEPSEMTFTTQTWNTSQLLTITPVDNRVDEDDRTAEIEFSLVSDDAGFGGRPVEPLVVTVADDDEPGSFVVESDDGLELSEDGSSITLDITLSTQPGGDVLVPVSVDDDTEAEIDVSQLTFTELNWNIAQQITVTGIDDLEADGDQTFNLVLGPTNSTEETFNGLPEQYVELTTVDGVCGNEVVDGTEDCEPGAKETMQCDYGVQDCNYCNDSCQQLAGQSAGYCGDGQVQSAYEDCDGPTERCDYGQMSCTTCDSCETVAGELTGYCGDGVVQQNEGEECDGSVCCSNSCIIDTNNCDVGCLVISEYVEASGNDKALELYNCDTSTINLTGLELCLVRNGESTCSRYKSLSGTLAAGDTRTICNNSSTIPSTYCDDLDGNVTQFNGDDRVVLHLNLDGMPLIGTGDVVIDAFGQMAVQPADGTWESKNYSRCNFTQYDGMSTFFLSSYWEDTGACDSFGCNYPQVYQGLGTPPVETCN